MIKFAWTIFLLCVSVVSLCACVWKKYIKKKKGKDSWKNDPMSIEYDYKRVEDNLKTLKHLIHSLKNSSKEGKSADDRDLIAQQLTFYLRSRLLRNLGGIGKYSLYEKLRVGTKLLIEEYLLTVEVK